MSEVIAHAPGTFCWIELGTTDQEGAGAFYRTLFGWDAQDDPIGPDSVYTTLSLGRRAVGGLYTLTEEQQEQGLPPHWGLYVATDDADAAAATARALGGTVLVEPFDVMTHGRMAVFQDPTGATLSVWEARNHAGAGVLNEPGSLVWSELATRDAAAAGAFYTGLFDWQAQEQEMSSGPYTSFMRGEEPAAGMLQMTAEWGEIPPHWMPYFGVSDCEAAVAAAEELGGAVVVAPTTIPEVGTFAVLRDPQGAVFSTIQMNHFAG